MTAVRAGRRWVGRCAVLSALVMTGAALGSPAAGAGDGRAGGADFIGHAGDFDGDHRDDIASFTRGIGGDVYVGRSTGRSFAGIGDLWTSGFARWSQVPLVGDVDGDGRSDAVAFTREDSARVDVALSTGRRFRPHTTWNSLFAPGSAVPAVGDVDGDHRADVVAFARGRTGRVAVATSTGRAFRAADRWADDFARGTSVPAVGDFDGDGRDDVVAFGRGRRGIVTVALSNGREFGRAERWRRSFARHSSVPAIGDFNGDGKDDVVAFGRGRSGGVTVALSTGRAFGPPQRWNTMFATEDQVPGVGDFDGDGKDDVVAFTRGGTADVWVALSTGSGFRTGRLRWHEYFAAATEVPQPGSFWN